ncbi:MAG TPA: subclass B3 metallo-beta-lactamase [Terriglobales bacterium]|nr:subclass B3 metallo-beta-lactamase [Terriglobales bacterium]
MRRLALLVVLISVVTAAHGQFDIPPAIWTQPVEPFHIAGNLYYVGSADLTSYLFVTPKGNILLDVGVPENVSMVEANIRKLGFHMKDVKILLNSHAHFDHAGGLQAVKKITGARVVASVGDAPELASGGRDDFAFGNRYPYPPVKADRIIQDGGRVELGGTVLTAHLTPGHTRGCTTWTTEIADGGKTYHAVFVCSVSFPGFKLVHNPKNPHLAADYQHSFQVLRSLPCDIFLASHGSFFDLPRKIAELKQSPSHNPFVDPAGYRRFLDHSQAAFEAELKTQMQGSRH